MDPEHSPADPPKRRRAHHKSRRGCLECKRRHIKCDERRPTCVNCDTSERTCCYPVRPTAQPLRRDSPSDWSADSPTAGVTSASDTAPTPSRSALLPALLQSPCHPDSNRVYTFQHLLLLHHVENGMADWLWVSKPMRNMEQVYINGALTSPFVMDQLLAVAAQHVCTIHPDLHDQYRSLATNLQTRALAGFKSAAADPSRHSLIGRFLFSSLMVFFAMADMAASSFHNDDVEHLFSRFVEFLRVTRGVRIVGDGAWSELYESSELGWIFSAFGNIEAYHEDPAPGFLSGVAQMLQRPGVDAATAEICSEAARALGFLQKQLDSPASWGVHAVMAWANLVDGAYTQLLADRRPEALVVLAHYASILYRHREFWVFGDLGRDLLVSIARSVAPEWLPYMTQPLEVLREGQKR